MMNASKHSDKENEEEAFWDFVNAANAEQRR